MTFGGFSPYYEEESITIFHGDCRKIVPHLIKFDLLLTDPPYGMDIGKKDGLGRDGSAQVKDYGEIGWDKEPVEDWVMLLARRLCQKQIIFGGNYYDLPPTSCWLMWDKENTGEFADGEMAWTNLEKPVRIKHHMWNGMIRKGQEQKLHPTQKPLEVISWALQMAGDVETILDPFAGSGTTGRAAKDLGKKAVLIEREEAYCEIAASRLAQEVLPLEAKLQKPRMFPKTFPQQEPKLPWYLDVDGDGEPAHNN